MAQRAKTAVLIDGSNLYHHLKRLGIPDLSHFDYRKMCEWLARGRPLVSCGYYVGAIRAKPNDTKGQALRKQQVNFFNHLRSSGQRFQIQLGYMMNNRGKYYEKGVDVHIAVDVVAGAYANRYDEAILISSDTDLLPAVREAINLGKKVEYIGFSHQPSLAMQKHATTSRLLIRDDLDPFAATPVS